MTSEGSKLLVLSSLQEGELFGSQREKDSGLVSSNQANLQQNEIEEI